MAAPASTTCETAGACYRVLMPDGTVLPLDGVVTVTRVVSTAARAAVMSVSDDQLAAALGSDVDFRSNKTRRVEKDYQTYGHLNKTSQAKPRRIGEEDAKQRDQNSRRQLQDEVRAAIESGAPVVPPNKADRKKSAAPAPTA